MNYIKALSCLMKLERQIFSIRHYCERPPAESRWLRVAAKVGSVRHAADSRDVKVVVRFRRCCVLIEEEFALRITLPICRQML